MKPRRNEEANRFLREFGASVRSERKARGWSHVALGRRLGISPGYVSMIENGQRQPGIYLAARIAAEFEVAIGDLLPGPASGDGAL